MRTGNILWPTDFSDTASHALQYAIEMANLYQ
ncbi:MAG: universal stress protein, partial [Paraglaciecola chathamensis]